MQGVSAEPSEAATDKSYGLGAEAPPLPYGAEMCGYGRLGALGRSLRDAPRFMRRPLVTALIIAVGGAAFQALFAPPNSGSAARFVYAIAGASAGLGATVFIGWAWALTPWGRRCHWEHTMHGYTIAGPLDGLGCSLVTHHYHEIKSLTCEVTDPQRNRVEHSMQVYLTKEQRLIVEPGDKLNSISDSHWYSGPGRYKFRWKATVDGRNKPFTVATATYRARRP
jgi:hypothetical protein